MSISKLYDAHPADRGRCMRIGHTFGFTPCFMQRSRFHGSLVTEEYQTVLYLAEEERPSNHVRVNNFVKGSNSANFIDILLAPRFRKTSSCNLDYSLGDLVECR